MYHGDRLVEAGGENSSSVVSQSITSARLGDAPLGQCTRIDPLYGRDTSRKGYYRSEGKKSK